LITHILFDFFGTLVDYSPSRTEQGYERSFSLLQVAGARLDYEAFLSLWSAVSEEFDEVAKRTCREFSMIELGSAFLQRVVDSPTDAFVRDFVQTYLAEWNKGVQYLDGLPEMIERLSGSFSLAIISNTNETVLVPNHLEQMDIADLFSQVITSVEFGIRKPSPAIFQHALRVLQVEADHCIYVGDSYEADFVGARRAGIRSLLIDPRCQADVADTDRLDTILDLEARLQSDPTRSGG